MDYEAKVPETALATWKLCFTDKNSKNYYGTGPDNPSTRQVSYMINRIKGNSINQHILQM